MRALLLHLNNFESAPIEQSNWPAGIEPEVDVSLHQPITMQQCLGVLFCVEQDDAFTQLDALYQDILKTALEIKTNNLLISSFVHLSNNIAAPAVAKEMCQQLLDMFVGSSFIVKTTPFGYHKSLLLDIKGHPGSFRYREF